MPNTLTGLIPTLYEALNTVSREMVGFIPAVTRNSSAERAALNQVLTIPIAPPTGLADNTPAVSAPNTGDQVMTNTTMTISKSKHAPIRWNGEEQRGLLGAGTYGAILTDQFTQAFRALVNEIEVDLFVATYQAASRAYGTAGTTPFATAGDLSDIAGVAQILDDNGAPKSTRQFVASNATVANLRGKQSVLFKVNEAGTAEMLREGSMTRLEGFNMFASGGITRHVKGTATGGLINNGAGEIVGETTLTLDTITAGATGYRAGDVVTFAADAVNKYVVNTGLASGAAGDIVIGGPGLLVAAPDNNAVTIGNNYTPNMAFTREAVQLITRAPAMPVGPGGQALDMADDVITVTDPMSGLSFEVAVYRQFMQLVYHVRLAWGVKAIKPPHIATLLG